MTTVVQTLEEEYLERATALVVQWCEGVIESDVRQSRHAELMEEFMQKPGEEGLTREQLTLINKERIIPLITNCSQLRERAR